MPFVDNCYLLKHAQGWLLWDTGVADAIATMPDGQKPANPGATHWYRPKTLASQLEALGVKPSDITFVAVSHTHGDHIGNVELFPQAMLLVQKAEYAWPGANNAPRFNPAHPVTKLEGDKGVFGDGSLTILSTPGHTPGHQSLLVKLPQTGALVLSGDAVHFQANWDNRVVPSMNADPGADQGVDGPETFLFAIIVGRKVSLFASRRCFMRTPLPVWYTRGDAREWTTRVPPLGRGIAREMEGAPHGPAD